MSNPYDRPPSDPYGEPGSSGTQPPEGSSPYQPYQAPGENPYGGSPYGGVPSGPVAGKRTDGVSIAGLVCSLTCCAAPVGIGLGIAGIVRTKNGKRAGRWAAVTAVVVGTVATLALVATTVVLVWFGNTAVLPSTADVGQCVDVDRYDTVDATLWKKDCDEEHDAEIAVVEEFDEDTIDSFDEDDATSFCGDYLSDQYLEAYESGEYYVGAELDDDEPDVGDTFICYVEPRGGKRLDAPIG